MSLINQHDEVKWTKKKDTSILTTKSSYKLKMDELVSNERAWWWKTIWKMDSSLKSKKKLLGPGWCIFCKYSLEYVHHVFVHRSFLH
jgi:hypothetical protein